MRRCDASCRECGGSGIKVYRAVESIGKTPVRSFTYDAECPRARGREMWLATFGTNNYPY